MEELDRALRWYAGNAADCLHTIESLNHDGLGTRLVMESEVPFGDDLHRKYVTELGRTWHNFVAGRIRSRADTGRLTRREQGHVVHNSRWLKEQITINPVHEHHNDARWPVGCRTTSSASTTRCSRLSPEAWRPRASDLGLQSGFAANDRICR
jgi:hypothetical protein